MIRWNSGIRLANNNTTLATNGQKRLRSLVPCTKVVFSIEHGCQSRSFTFTSGLGLKARYAAAGSRMPVQVSQRAPATRIAKLSAAHAARALPLELISLPGSREWIQSNGIARSASQASCSTCPGLSGSVSDSLAGWLLHFQTPTVDDCFNVAAQIHSQMWSHR